MVATIGASARPLICGEGQDSSKRIDVFERMKADAAESPRGIVATQRHIRVRAMLHGT